MGAAVKHTMTLTDDRVPFAALVNRDLVLEVLL